MPRPKREGDLRVRGMGLGPRFVLAMTFGLAVVMSIAAVLLYIGSTNLAEKLVEDTVASGVRLTQSTPLFKADATARELPNGVDRTALSYGPDLDHRGVAYSYTDPEGEHPRTVLLVPEGEKLGPKMLGLIVGILVVVIVAGAGIGYWVAKTVTRPIHRLIEDVRQIAMGDLDHRTRATGAGEIELLSRSIDRMTRDLEDAREAELALSIREREMEVASGVREALLPLATPLVPGYDLGGAHISAAGQIGGDFHDFVELGDGRVGLLVCDVSGRGVPAALVGATARSYLRGELSRGGDPAEAFRRVNRWLGEDVRRGMYVTALYALLDPARGVATVVCAGHKVPLLRYTREDGKLRVIQPEGIALGFDQGQVFDNRLEVQDVPIAPGDRLFASNSAPLRIQDREGRELGEKGFFSRVLRYSPLPTGECLKALRRDLSEVAGEDGVQLDVSLVTVARTEES